jgi:hypothetical protein
MAHLFAVTGLVLEDGGDETEAIAAMLHDAVEHGGGRPMLARIHRRFGRRVAEIVEGCSDAIDCDPGESWIDRKRRYLAHLAEVSDDAVLRVALADKVHSAACIVRTHRLDGHPSDGFTQGTTREQLWYFGGLLAFFERSRPGPLTEEFARGVDELVQLVAVEDARRIPWRRLWMDADLYAAPSPDGWIQVRSAAQAIELLDEFNVHEVSLEAGPDADAVIHWLVDRGPDDPRLWPTVWLSFHGAESETWFDRLAWAGSGPLAT